MKRFESRGNPNLKNEGSGSGTTNQRSPSSKKNTENNNHTTSKLRLDTTTCMDAITLTPSEKTPKLSHSYRVHGTH
jgi:hypothetical protein